MQAAIKPLSPSPNKGAQEVSKSLSPKPVDNAPAGAKPPSSGSMEKTPKPNKPLSPAATEGTPGSNWEKTPKMSSPCPSPQLYGLGAAGGVPTGGESARPWVEKTSSHPCPPPTPWPRTQTSLKPGAT
jgi:hypothetical protein